MADSIFGTITPPAAIDKIETTAGNNGNGIFLIINTALRIAGSIAGLFFVVQIIMAGYQYLSASGDEKKMAQAWATIWQSLIGIIIVASAFVLANVIGYVLNLNITNPSFTQIAP